MPLSELPLSGNAGSEFMTRAVDVVTNFIPLDIPLTKFLLWWQRTGYNAILADRTAQVKVPGIRPHSPYLRTQINNFRDLCMYTCV